MRSACAPIAGGPGQSMPKLTCAPRKLAWAPMARNVIWLVPSCLQRLSTRVREPVKLVAGKLIYTAWPRIHLLQQGFRRLLAARNWTRATYARTIGGKCGTLTAVRY